MIFYRNIKNLTLRSLFFGQMERLLRNLRMYKDELEYSISWLLTNRMAGLTLQSEPLLKYFTQSVIYKHTKLSRLQTVIEPLIFLSYPGPFARFVCDSTNSFSGDLKHKITLIRNNILFAAIICNTSVEYT